MLTFIISRRLGEQIEDLANVCPYSINWVHLLVSIQMKVMKITPWLRPAQQSSVVDSDLKLSPKSQQSKPIVNIQRPRKH